jgi:hypothetical protein
VHEADQITEGGLVAGAEAPDQFGVIESRGRGHGSPV